MSDPRESIESVVVECELADPPETVWRALTEPELVEAWLPASDEPHVDRHIVEAEPHRRLRYSWHDGGDVESIVTFELAPTPAGGTRLRVVHTGIPAAMHAPLYMMRAA